MRRLMCGAALFVSMTGGAMTLAESPWLWYEDITFRIMCASNPELVQRSLTGLGQRPLVTGRGRMGHVLWLYLAEDGSWSLAAEHPSGQKFCLIDSGVDMHSPAEVDL